MPVVLLSFALEMCQNSARLSWTAEEVDTNCQIMVDIFHKVDDASKRYDMEATMLQALISQASRKL